jgi:hypothetical protein
MQNKEIKKKSNQICKEKYGFENCTQNKEIHEKSKQTCFKNYGVYYPSQNEKVREKQKQYCLEIYGVENAMQNEDVMERSIKNSHKLKDFTFPSGKIIKIQGYEHFALKELIEQENVNENDIINGCKNVPKIFYDDETGKKHRHYVDIFIPSQNRCIEVKSKWTLKKKQDNVFLKQTAGKALGYNYEIWVYDAKGNKVECH